MSKVALKKNEMTLIKVVVALWVVATFVGGISLLMLCSITSRQPLSSEDVARMVQTMPASTDLPANTDRRESELALATRQMPPTQTLVASTAIPLVGQSSTAATTAPMAPTPVPYQSTMNRTPSANQTGNLLLGNAFKLASLVAILFFAFSLGWTEVIIRNQGGDMIVPFMAMIFMVIFTIASLLNSFYSWIPFLVFVVGLIGSFIGCKQGKTDYSPMSFYFACTGILLYMFSPVITFFDVAETCGIIFLVIAAGFSLYEIKRENIPIRSILVGVLYAALQAGVISVMLTLHISPALGIMVVHIGLLIVTGNAAKVITFWAIKFRFISDEMQWKPSHWIPLDALIFVNLLVGLAIALFA